MPKLTAKPIKVTIDVKPGEDTPNKRQLWSRFWQKLIVEVKASER